MTLMHRTEPFIREWKRPIKQRMKFHIRQALLRLMKNSMQNQRGFTLIELMITVAIAAILLAVGLPSMRTFIQNGHITSATNELVSAINKARDVAINTPSSACVCPSADANNAVPTCAASGNWETGMIAFSDFNGDCVINNVGGTDVLLKVWDGSQYAGVLTVRTTSASISATNSILFNQLGEPRQANGSSQQGVFKICDDRGLVSANNTSSTAAGVVLSAGGSAWSTRSATQIIACP